MPSWSLAAIAALPLESSGINLNVAIMLNVVGTLRRCSVRPLEQLAASS